MCREDVLKLVQLGTRIMGTASLIGCVLCYVAGGEYILNGIILTVFAIAMFAISMEWFWDIMEWFERLTSGVPGYEDYGKGNGKFTRIHRDGETLNIISVKKGKKLRMFNASIDDSGLNISKGYIESNSVGDVCKVVSFSNPSSVIEADDSK